MGRPLRIEYPNAFYHITSRGNERKAIYHRAKDYEKFIGYLKSATDRYGAAIHCFCLLPNHAHLFLQTPRGNLCAILHHINTSYTNYFNRKTRRAGHLFQGRYRGILVEGDTYALELSRYIHLNPVRAHLVKAPSNYPWSSYSAYIEGESKWGWVHRNFILEQISPGEKEAQEKYRDYVEGSLDQTPENPLEKATASILLGSDTFVEWVKKNFIGKATSHRDVPALAKLSLWPSLSTIQDEVERKFEKGSSIARRGDFSCSSLQRASTGRNWEAFWRYWSFRRNPEH